MAVLQLQLQRVMTVLQLVAARHRGVADIVIDSISSAAPTGAFS
eukprot:CAMPEP_0179458004 /NCGR_PEP_ID=MMETSP0799-20121207/41653_1 /TAXON_ID=46947 /ORGANISM="Geminigera cryophila, Strain CCMP2564" /LENGTH=43 /DNA_ID= /DNA_START= /DNA_END= /DNA_ORIENTATION=